jgi:hypothetical protein
MATLMVGGGALRSPKDDRDYNLAFLASAPAPIEWREQPLGRPEPPNTYQGAADCCVGEMTSSMNFANTKRQFSVRSVFAYIAQEYGAYLRSGPMRVVNFGQQTYQEAPDPDPKTMQNMRDQSGLNPQLALKHKAFAMFSTNGRSIDQLAQAIRDWSHVGIGVELSKEGWWPDLTNPRPPKQGESTNGHALMCFDYHLHNGKRCLIAKSSWCMGDHHVHHINEDYIHSYHSFGEAYVLVPRSNMVTRYIVQKGGKLGVLVSVDGDGIFTDTIFWAKSEAHFNQLKTQYEVPDNALRVIYPV